VHCSEMPASRSQGVCCAARVRHVAELQDSVCAQALPLLRGAPPAALEAAADAFQRQAVACGEVLALAGRPLDKARP